MEPNDLDPINTAALVMRVIDDIDRSSAERRENLLNDLLRAAWGSLAAQSQ